LNTLNRLVELPMVVKTVSKRTVSDSKLSRALVLEVNCSSSEQLKKSVPNAITQAKIYTSLFIDFYI